MANINFYKKHPNLLSVDEICKTLTDTLIETNYTYEFFVNWSKVSKNRDAFKYEVALLKSLKNSSNPSADFCNLLTNSENVGITTSGVFGMVTLAMVLVLINPSRFRRP